ncbi:MAG: RNA methyltransferase [Muribaculaceae bacterium]|nr:RNA methyltransferase [Muribaculaceae bacterium]
MDKFQMVAKTFQGLEEVLRDELINLGAENVEIGKRMVQFEGDLAMMYKANICCRTALRILKPIVKFTASNPDELYDAVREIEWEKYMTPDSTFSIDSTVTSADFTHSRFVTYRVKDGIVDHFNDICGRRPSIRLQDADVELNVHISDNRVTISLDSSGEPLSKRGYKVENTEAPINEVLAAGILLLTGWKGECPLADPMCGSGTFLIEAALIAANINPGIYREKFAFEKWEDFDADLFEEIYNDDSGEREIDYPLIYGGDKDPEAVRIARSNVRNAKVEKMVELSCRDLQEWDENDREGILVTNPPYGVRINPQSMSAKAFYRTLGTCLKENFQNWDAWIIGLAEGFMQDIGLKPSMKYPLMNGGLECTLNEYVMFKGEYREFRAEGGVVKHQPRQEAPKIKRMSDREWEDEAKRFDGKSRKKDFDRNARPKRDDKPFRSDRPKRDDKPFRSDRPKRDDKPFRSDRPKRDDKPFRSDRPKRDDKPFRSDRPRRDDKPFRSERPKRDDKPFRSERPQRDEGPRQIFDRGPRLTDFVETRAPGKMRARKNAKRFSTNDDDE